MTACATTERVVVKSQVEYQFPPEASLHCKKIPLPPPHEATKGDWQDAYALVEDAGLDCSDKIDAIREWTEKRRKELNPSPPAG